MIHLINVGYIATCMLFITLGELSGVHALEIVSLVMILPIALLAISWERRLVDEDPEKYTRAREGWRKAYFVFLLVWVLSLIARRLM